MCMHNSLCALCNMHMHVRYTDGVTSSRMVSSKVSATLRTLPLVRVRVRC